MESNIRSTPIIGLITAESLSLLGNQIGAVTIPILVLQFTNSPIVTGIASFSAGLAGLLLAGLITEFSNVELVLLLAGGLLLASAIFGWYSLP